MTLSKRKYRNVVSTWSWKNPVFSFILQILRYLTLFKKCYWQVWLEWTEHQFKYFSFFSECMPGYSGLNCTTRCPYPLYGYRCQGYCDCSIDTCDVSTGCRTITTGQTYYF